ncbi:MAG: hypothetical protein KF912_10020 [Phycisphaeraceae bacterium]|nr:hypothetical protein [Phycisphaeraceae bacterium]MBX3367632.1 hypothetical protein [Phycisphaeraceae bacterium]
MKNDGFLALVGVAIAAGLAGASEPQTTSNFLDIPGAFFLDIDNESSSTPFGPFIVVLGSETVVVTSSIGSGGSPDMYGFFTAPVSWMLARDEEADPGNRNGYYRTITSNLYTILDFSTPLTGFGATFAIRSHVGSSPAHLPDTIYAYDGPGATGNMIASITTAEASEIQAKYIFDFVGVYVDGPPVIRSVILAGGPLGEASEIQITGIALAIATGEPPCASDVNGDTESDILDFLDYFDSFGTCDGLPAPCSGSSGVDADFNGDTIVDILDLLEFFDAFGIGCD